MKSRGKAKFPVNFVSRTIYFEKGKNGIQFRDVPVAAPGACVPDL